MKLLDSGQHSLETNRVGIEHGTAAPCGKPVAVHVYDIDIRGAKCDTFAKHARALIHERENAAVDDFIATDAAAFDARRVGALFDEGGSFGVGRGLAILVVAGPAAAGLLAEAAEFA